MVIPDIFGTAANYKTGVMQNLARQCTGDAGLCKKGFCHPEPLILPKSGQHYFRGDRKLLLSFYKQAAHPRT